MKYSPSIFKIAFLLFTVSMLFGCSKDDDPVTLAEVEVAEFDYGNLTVTLYDDPVYLDSILYINNTQGTSFKVERSEFTGYNSQLNTVTQISRTLINGFTNDQVQCCFYVNSPMMVKARFDSASVVDSVSTGGNAVFCVTGLY